MPFTPFHIGAALIVKLGLDRNFSVVTFGLAQVAMDIEPGIGMLTGADVLHGPTHTILGALLIASLLILIAPRVCTYLLQRWNKEVIHHKLAWLVQPETPSKTAVAVSAFFGTLSHVALDSLMHHDIRPLSPFSDKNPLLGFVSHDGVYQLCAIAGGLGAVAWVAMQWFRRSNSVVTGNVSSDPMEIGASKGFWKVWVGELWGNWIWVFLLSIGPGIYIGSGLFSVFALVFGTLIAVPAAVFSRAGDSASASKALRRLALWVLVPVLTLIHVYTVDKQIPTNAEPLTRAIAAFQMQTGHYPASLDELSPKYLSELPNVRFTLEQPEITYRLKDGKPYLSIPSARGDAFAEYEYDFESKSWVHHS